jgi:RHS repeat-associated protein
MSFAYTYDAAGNRTSVAKDGVNPRSYTLDALNRLTNVTYADGTGALSGSADFDVYGAVRTSSGSTAAFAFTGEQSDPETGFTYLRARYYDPAGGRFGAVDTVIPNAPGTQGYNPYAYVAGNPVRWVDPSGHSLAEAGMFNKRNATAAGPIAALGRLLAGTFDKLSCALDIRCRSLWTVIGTAAAGTATGWVGANPPDRWPPIPVPPTCAFTGSCGALPGSGGGWGSAPAAGGATGNPPAVGNPPITGTGIGNHTTATRAMDAVRAGECATP